MLFKFLKSSDVKSSEITSPEFYHNRRQFIKNTGQFGLRMGLGMGLGMGLRMGLGMGIAGVGSGLMSVSDAEAKAKDKLTPYKAVTTYNNFYEFGTDKEDPAQNAHTLRPRPWSVTIDGHVEKPGVYDLDDLLSPHTAEERIYRMRCVEAWSMVIPWGGIPLGDIIRRLGPTSKAEYVRFETLMDKEQMPGQKRRVMIWPYVEGLRLDEAMHPLTLLATGLYGEDLPHQNGAPLRLVVPWKYGFKGIKSIVRISFVDYMPKNSWNILAPREYGFYANVNPQVDHPRWSQATERRIGDFFRRDTMMYNGYGEEVADLYRGMDLKRNF